MTQAVPCNLADITEIGGSAETPGLPDNQLTVDDIIVFVNSVSDGTACPGPAPCNLADVTGIGGPPEIPDGQLTIDDIIAFFNAFDDGCSVANGPVNANGSVAVDLAIALRAGIPGIETNSRFSIEDIGSAGVDAVALYYHANPSDYYSRIRAGTVQIDRRIYLPAVAFFEAEEFPSSWNLVNIRVSAVTGTFFGMNGNTHVLLSLVEWNEMIDGEETPRAAVAILRCFQDLQECSEIAEAHAAASEAAARASLLSRSITPPTPNSSAMIEPPTYRPGRATSRLTPGDDGRWQQLTTWNDGDVTTQVEIIAPINAYGMETLCTTGDPHWASPQPTVQVFEWWIKAIGDWEIQNVTFTDSHEEYDPPGPPGDKWCRTVEFDVVKRFGPFAWFSVELSRQHYVYQKCVCCCLE